MSDEKKEIHVKDLIIKADNVHFEPVERKSDPWFGAREAEVPPHHEEHTHEEPVDHKEDDEERRPPFFWI
ncbi:hypothetical protein [Halalkalibacillus halophilus]|uniref:hypothetical protein n=1 Tax=Halalkalibacillus halophilus TaxID=392827 RepID=UPI0003FDA54F|nr:hypothetical protein [Halalkalibacillus halophilus]